MHESNPLVEMNALDTILERQQTAHRLRPAPRRHRRTTRRALASGLHRLADRLEVSPD